MVKRSQGRKTLASLAAELGVSPTTVSNAYNRPDQLSPATRQRILAAAQARGYPGPDPMARNLRTRRSGSVGVVLTEDLSYAFEDRASVDFLAGMAEASAGSRTTLTLIPAGPDTAGLGDRPDGLLAGAAVDGFVIYSVAADDPYIAAARLRRLPVVICDQPKDTGLPFVGIDDRAAIAPAAEALVRAGHRRIGILAIRLMHHRVDGELSLDSVRQAQMHVQRARVLGALDVFSAAGIEPESVPIITRHINDAANARSAAAQLLDTYPDLTAVLCTTDSMALAVLDDAASRGLSVPSDLSVTGFDGIEAAVLRGLSTVMQPNKAKGAAAGHMLTQLIGRAVAAPRRLVPTSFSPGTTVAPPRDR